jgi:hypothetical protein
MTNAIYERIEAARETSPGVLYTRHRSFESLRAIRSWPSIGRAPVIVKTPRRLGQSASSPPPKVHDETGRDDAGSPFGFEATWSVVEFPPEQRACFFRRYVLVSGRQEPGDRRSRYESNNFPRKRKEKVAWRGLNIARCSWLDTNAA